MTSVLAAYRMLDDDIHRAAFYRMWHAAHGASFPHPKAMESMGPLASPRVEEARRWLLAGTASRKALTDVVASGGARFDACERALIALGEESGRLDQSLKLLGEYFTRRHQLMLWVKKQMNYPMMTGLASGVIGPMTLLTKGLVGWYVASVCGTLLLLGTAAGGALLAVANRFAGRPPLARARLARALATAIEAGLPLGRSLRLAAQVSGNEEIAAHINRWSERELSTQSIAVTLAACPHITVEFRAAIETAERTGDFTIVTRLAQLYEDGFK